MLQLFVALQKFVLSSLIKVRLMRFICVTIKVVQNNLRFVNLLLDKTYFTNLI